LLDAVSLFFVNTLTYNAGARRPKARALGLKVANRDAD
jgi:hypothetical protein